MHFHRRSLHGQRNLHFGCPLLLPIVFCLALGLMAPRRAQAQETDTILHTFGANDIGSNPFSGLIQGQDGAFYGTTGLGGYPVEFPGSFGGYGTVFRMDAAGAVTTLHCFSPLLFTGSGIANPDGAYPSAGLVQGSDGALYGTTFQGGAYNEGTIFRVNPDGSGFATLHSFNGTTDGGYSYANLIVGSDGRLYGTASSGGASGNGTIFRLDTDGSDFMTLYAFSGGADGGQPYSGVIQGMDGRLYTTTAIGGLYGSGTVFKISTDGFHFATLYSFTGDSDGGFPVAGVIQGSDGNLFGVAAAGGANGDGTIYRLRTNGSAFTTLHSFDYNDGASPGYNLIQGSDGMLYGTASYGGPNYAGTVFQVSASGKTFHVLHAFDGVTDGNSPACSLLQGSDGTVYKITPDGDFSLLHTFAGSDGSYPFAGLILGSDGLLYGTTSLGGPGYTGPYTGSGTVFQISPDGSIFHSLYAFGASSSDGTNPDGALLQATDGRLYGTMYFGGSGGLGTVFRLNLDGSGYMQLNSFLDSGADGELPEAGLVEGANGNLYGTTSRGNAFYLFGTVFMLPAQLPIVSSINPNTGSASAGTPVTIRGVNLAGATVSIAGASQTVQGASATEVRFTLAANTPAGRYPIQVSTPNGVATSARDFTVGP